MILEEVNNHQIIIYNHNNRLNLYKDLLKGVVKTNPEVGLYNENEDIIEISTDILVGDPKIDLILNQFKNKYKTIVFDLAEIED